MLKDVKHLFGQSGGKEIVNSGHLKIFGLQGIRFPDLHPAAIAINRHTGITLLQYAVLSNGLHLGR